MEGEKEREKIARKCKKGLEIPCSCPLLKNSFVPYGTKSASFNFCIKLYNST